MKSMPPGEKFAAALRILRRLREEGHEAYLAGGCVRDLLLDREPSDYDVATSATPQVVLDLFPRTFAVGAHFGVVLVAEEASCAGTLAQESVPSQGEGCDLCDPALATKTKTSRGWGTRREGADSLASPQVVIPGVHRAPLQQESLAPPQVVTPQPFRSPLPLEKLAPPQVAQVVTEVATFRADGAYSDGRHPDAVRYTRSAEEDVQRRDFTINGLLLDPLVLMETSCDPTLATKTKTSRGWGTQFRGRASQVRGESGEPPSQVPESGPGAPGSWIDADGKSWKSADESSAWLSKPSDPAKLRAAVIDHVGGLADLDAGIVRAIGRPEARFEEDHLRMLRAVRFAARFGFALDTATECAIRRLAPLIADVSRERVREELTKMLTEGRARSAFELLHSTGLLAEVLPEIERMVGVEQPPQFHPEGDVWAHTLMLLGQLEPGCPMTLGWGALLHDVGKPATFSRGADRIHFNGHAEIGVAVAAEICRRFRFSNGETRQILSLVENHMRFMDVQRMKDSTLKRFFRLDHFEEHLALHRMDCLGSKGDLENWKYARKRWQAMPAEAVRPKLLVTGRELIAAGYKPGAAFRLMLDAAEEAQLEGSVTTAAEALALLREHFGPPDADEPEQKTAASSPSPK